jgi:hypothetical protein
MKVEVHLPLNPATCNGVRVDFAAPRTFLFICGNLPHNNTYLEFHSRLDTGCERGRPNYLAIISAKDFVVTPPDKVDFLAIFAMYLDNILKILSDSD